MNARHSKCVVSVMLIVTLALGIAPFASAQEGPRPETRGLRPDAPSYALHGPHWVGTLNFVIGPETQRPLQVTIWYPAVNPNWVPEEVTYTYTTVYYGSASVKGHAIAGAPPDVENGPYPLVIASHGSDNTRFFALYLTEHLASHGFVVMSAQHTPNSTGDALYPNEDYTRAIGTSMVYRPQDIRREIDYAATLTGQGGRLSGLIDVEHTAVVGYSYGGYSALAATGGRVGLGPFRDWCNSVANDPAVSSSWGYLFMCTSIVYNEEQLIAMQGANAKPGDLWPAFDITGVDAIVPMAPFSYPFLTGGLDGVTVPAMVITGTLDPDYEGAHKPTYDLLSSTKKALVVFDNAAHALSFEGCDELQQSSGWWIGSCLDSVWEPNRAHDLINHFSTAFLLATLKNDAEAAAALSPEAVQFPGVTYEATGF